MTQPFLKWAGGKQRLIPQIAPLLPRRFNVYHEPFLGGGAMFLHLRDQGLAAQARLSDSNAELINAWQVVQCEPLNLIVALRKHDAAHRLDADYYYRVRAMRPDEMANNGIAPQTTEKAAKIGMRHSKQAKNAHRPPLTVQVENCRDDVARAARTLYLNRTAFNGLYRVNRRGEFNVAKGRYADPNVVNGEVIMGVCQMLSEAAITCADFRATLDRANAGDFVYFDPPYIPTSATARFTGYTPGGFVESDQRDLAALCRALDRRGTQWMMSNADTPLARHLYHGFLFVEIEARRAINCHAGKRGCVKEVIVTNYVPAQHNFFAKEKQ
jgi:DNA adenine methylase